DLHQAHPLAIALRVRHPEVAARALVEVAALLLADERDRPAAEAGEAGDERRVLGSRTVAVQLDEVLEEALHVVERVRPLRVAGEVDGSPDLLVGRLGLLDPVELSLQPLGVTGQPRAPEGRQGGGGGRGRPREGARLLRALWGGCVAD